MESREIVLQLDARWYDALEKSLKNTTIEDRLHECLDEMLNQIPAGEYERISSEIWEEESQARRQQEAERVFSIFRVTQNGKTDCFETDHPIEFLDAANALRRYLHGQSGRSFVSAFPERSDLTDERFEQYAAERMENTGRVAGAFQIDLDKGELSALNIMDGWQVFSVKDVSTAAYHAMRRKSLSRDKQFGIFVDYLDGRQFSPMTVREQEKFLCEETPVDYDMDLLEETEQEPENSEGPTMADGMN